MTYENQKTRAKGRALFLDRDGVINEEVGYLVLPEHTRFVRGIFDLCRAAKGLGYRLIVVTNQAGIARGYYSEEDFLALMNWVRGEFDREGCALDAVYYCPSHPEYGVGEYKRDSIDRKPGPGMLLRGADEFNLDLSASVFVGDRCTDVGAGTAAGIGAMFLLEGTEQENCSGAGEYKVIQALEELRRWLCEQR